MSSNSHPDGELEIRLRHACAEVDRRVRAGETDVVQDFLANQPEFASHEDLAIELIYAEFVTLEELGAAPSPGETFTKFPQWRSRLERLFQVHNVFRDEAEIDLDRSSETLAKIDSTCDGDADRRGDSDRPLPRRIAQYELIEEIARGGMGIVYQARQRGLDRVVAIKVIRSSQASDVERSRFRTEAEAAAKLKHPNTVQIYDVGEDGGLAYLCMEYVSGGSLEKRLANGRPSIHAAAQLISTIAVATNFAHQQGIIHRDLKPGNILLDGEVPKIGDFGLAKRTLEGLEKQTQTGDVLGTPCYMSPEQAEGRTEDVGPHSDIYALGAILYEMLAGRPPFVGETPLATIDLIRNQDPAAPSSMAPKVPRDLDTICLKCLSKEPARRYNTAQELADDLNRFLDHQPIHARRVGIIERTWRWARRRPAITGLAATLLVVLFIGSIVVAWQQRHVGELSKSASVTKRIAARSELLAKAATEEAGHNLQAARQAIERMSSLGVTLYHQPGMGATGLEAAEQALDHYQVLLEKKGDDPNIRWEAARIFITAGNIQFQLGLWFAAEETYTQAANIFDTLENDNADVDYGRSWSLIRLGHCQRKLEKREESRVSYDVAIGILERLLQAEPNNIHYADSLAHAILNQAVVYKRLQPEWAEPTFCRAIRLQRRIIERKAGLGNGPFVEKYDDDAHKSSRREILAAQTLRRRVAAQDSALLADMVDGGHFAALALSLDDFGSMLRSKKSAELAEIAIREAMELRRIWLRTARGEDGRQYFLARSYTHVGRIEFAKKDYEAAAKSHAAALSIVKKLSETFPHRLTYERRLGKAHTDLGHVLGYCHRFEDAKASHLQAIEIRERLVRDYPTLPRLADDLAIGVYYFGNTLRRMNQSKEAVEHFQRVLDLNPKYDPAINELAWTFLMDQDLSLRDPERGLQLAQQAVELDCESGAYRNTLGVAYFRNGDYAQAIRTLRESVELRNGGDGFDWYFLAMSYAHQGDKKLASEWFDRAQAWCRTQLPLSEELRLAQAEAEQLFNR